MLEHEFQKILKDLHQVIKTKSVYYGDPDEHNKIVSSRLKHSSFRLSGGRIIRYTDVKDHDVYEVKQRFWTI